MFCSMNVLKVRYLYSAKSVVACFPTFLLVSHYSEHLHFHDNIFSTLMLFGILNFLIVAAENLCMGVKVVGLFGLLGLLILAVRLLNSLFHKGIFLGKKMLVACCNQSTANFAQCSE